MTSRLGKVVEALSTGESADFQVLDNSWTALSDFQCELDEALTLEAQGVICVTQRKNHGPLVDAIVFRKLR